MASRYVGEVPNASSDPIDRAGETVPTVIFLPPERPTLQPDPAARTIMKTRPSAKRRAPVELYTAADEPVRCSGLEP